MKLAKKIALCLGLLLLFCLAWRLAFPTKIIGLHQQDGVLVVKNFPVTKYGRMWWWHKNQRQLLQAFRLPGKRFSVAVIDFDEGYQTQEQAESDAYCFADIAKEERCINKKFLMYIEEENGKIVLQGHTWFYLPEDLVFIATMMVVMPAFALRWVMPFFFLSCLYFSYVLWKKKEKDFFYALLFCTLVFLLLTALSTFFILSHDFDLY